jgi:hypothetical protein
LEGSVGGVWTGSPLGGAGSVFCAVVGLGGMRPKGTSTLGAGGREAAGGKGGGGVGRAVATGGGDGLGSATTGGVGTLGGSIVTSIGSSSGSGRLSGETHHNASAVTTCSSTASAAAVGDMRSKREYVALMTWVTVTRSRRERGRRLQRFVNRAGPGNAT